MLQNICTHKFIFQTPGSQGSKLQYLCVLVYKHVIKKKKKKKYRLILYVNVFLP